MMEEDPPCKQQKLSNSNGFVDKLDKFLTLVAARHTLPANFDDTFFDKLVDYMPHDAAAFAVIEVYLSRLLSVEQCSLLTIRLGLRLCSAVFAKCTQCNSPIDGQFVVTCSKFFARSEKVMHLCPTVKESLFQAAKDRIGAMGPNDGDDHFADLALESISGTDTESLFVVKSGANFLLAYFSKMSTPDKRFNQLISLLSNRINSAFIIGLICDITVKALERHQHLVLADEQVEIILRMAQKLERGSDSVWRLAALCICIGEDLHEVHLAPHSEWHSKRGRLITVKHIVMLCHAGKADKRIKLPAHVAADIIRRHFCGAWEEPKLFSCVVQQLTELLPIILNIFDKHTVVDMCCSVFRYYLCGSSLRPTVSKQMVDALGGFLAAFTDRQLLNDCAETVKPLLAALLNARLQLSSLPLVILLKKCPLDLLISTLDENLSVFDGWLSNLNSVEWEICDTTLEVLIAVGGSLFANDKMAECLAPFEAKSSTLASNHCSQFVRASALTLLNILNPEKAFKMALTVSNLDSDPLPRRCAAELVLNSEYFVENIESVQKILPSLVHDADLEVKSTAVELCVKVLSLSTASDGPDASFGLLVESLEDPEVSVSALGALKSLVNIDSIADKAKDALNSVGVGEETILRREAAMSFDPYSVNPCELVEDMLIALEREERAEESGEEADDHGALKDCY